MTVALRLPDVVPTATSLLDWVPLDPHDATMRCVCGGVRHATLDPNSRLIEQCDKCWAIAYVLPRRNAPVVPEHLSLIALAQCHKSSFRDMSERKITKQCSECTREFRSPIVNHRMCCSADCAMKRRKRLAGERRTNRPPRLCKNGCGREVKPIRQFCSRVCNGIYQTLLNAKRRREQFPHPAFR